MTEQGQQDPRPYIIDREPDDEIDLAQLWGIIAAGKWQIALAVAVALVLAIFYLFVTEPVYRTSALLQVQSDSASALQGLTSEVQQLTGKGSSRADAEIQIIKSRSVLGAAVDKLGLDIAAGPAYFPIIGEALARRRQPPDNPGNKDGWLDHFAWLDHFGRLDHFAWYPAEIRISRFNVPQRWLGQPFTVRAASTAEYNLIGPEGNEILKGRVGEPATGNMPDGGEVHLFVAAIDVIDPPVDFTVGKMQPVLVTDSLASRLSVSEQGQDTGIIRVSLEGEDPEHIKTIVNTIADTYLRQNVEARSKQAEQSLEFLKEQLPELRSEVEQAEGNLANYQEENQALDLTTEAESLLGQVVELERSRSELELKRAELRRQYTAEHPQLEVLESQLRELAQRRQGLQGQINTLPETQREILSLKRNVKVNTELYTALLNRAQELRVVKAGTVGNVRIVDHAVRSVQPVAPQAPLVLLLSIFLGGFVGVGYVFARQALAVGVSDPNEVEEKLGIPIYAVVPHSAKHARAARRAEKRGEAIPLLVEHAPKELAVEALRSLRTGLHFAGLPAERPVVVISGPAPDIGKSFISVNLGLLLAEAGQKVLIVDGDMRKGHLHEYPGVRRNDGFSEALAGKSQGTLHQFGEYTAWLMTSGTLPPNPSELLMRDGYPDFIERMRHLFDIILIDSPPVMAVTDAALLSAHADATFMVLEAGRHPIAEIRETAKRLVMRKGGNGRVTGAVFNNMRQSSKPNSRYGQYGYHQYEYGK